MKEIVIEIKFESESFNKLTDWELLELKSDIKAGFEEFTGYSVDNIYININERE